MRKQEEEEEEEGEEQVHGGRRFREEKSVKNNVNDADLLLRKEVKIRLYILPIYKVFFF